MEQEALALSSVAKKPAVLLNTSHARDMLHKRYPAPEWALLEEVAPATGGGTRYADAVAVNLWQSRGHAVHGFEIKVSRGDWLKELKDPSKAEPIYRYCDYWWIVAPRDIIKPGELPPNWGHLELRATGLTQVVNAPKLTAEPLTRAFFASIMRRGHEQIDQLAERKQRVAVMDARAAIDAQVKQDVASATRQHEELRTRVAKFEAETGLSFQRDWEGPPIEVVKLAMRIHKLESWSGERSMGRLARLAGELEQAAKTVRQAIEDTKLQQEVAP